MSKFTMLNIPNRLHINQAYASTSYFPNHAYGAASYMCIFLCAHSESLCAKLLTNGIGLELFQDMGVSI